MPGLLKIGTTTNTPNERMSELHSTGVPTPFQLELSIKVTNGFDAEKISHNALANYRVAKNREFFRIGVEKAIEIILSSLDNYEIHEFKTGLKTREIEKETNRRKLKKEKENYDRTAKEVNEKTSKKNSLQLKKHELEIKVIEFRNSRRKLGSEPISKDLNGIDQILMTLYIPLPFGFMTWGALFNPAFTPFVIPILILGYFANRRDNKNQEKNSLQLAPFIDLDNRIYHLDGEIKTITTELENLEIPVLPRNPYTKPEEKPEQMLKQKPSKPAAPRKFRTDLIEVTCKNCNFWFLHKDVHLFSCPKCHKTIFRDDL